MRQKLAILAILASLFVSFAAEGAYRISQPYKRHDKSHTHRPYEPGAPTDDIIISTDEEAVFLVFDSPQGTVNYVIENTDERYVIAEYEHNSSVTIAIPLSIFNGNCAILATTELDNSYIIFVEN